MRWSFENHRNLYDLVSTYKLHPYVKNKFLLEELISKNYIQCVVTEYLRYVYSDPRLFYEPNDRISQTDERYKFVEMDVAFVTIGICFKDQEDINRLKLKDPKYMRFIKDNFVIEDLGW